MKLLTVLSVLLVAVASVSASHIVKEQLKGKPPQQQPRQSSSSRPFLCLSRASCVVGNRSESSLLEERLLMERAHAHHCSLCVLSAQPFLLTGRSSTVLMVRSNWSCLFSFVSATLMLSSRSSGL